MIENTHLFENFDDNLEKNEFLAAAFRADVSCTIIIIFFKYC